MFIEVWRYLLGCGHYVLDEVGTPGKNKRVGQMILCARCHLPGNKPPFVEEIIVGITLVPAADIDQDSLRSIHE